jgi:hypothetical protein
MRTSHRTGWGGWRAWCAKLGTSLNFPIFSRHPAIVLAAMNTSLPLLLRISNAVR